MIRRILCLLLVVLFLSNPTIARTKKNLSPREFTKQFYSLLYELKISGLPNADEFKMIAPFLNPSLRRLILAAKQKQEKYIKENPTNKPPWIEDDLFSISEEIFRYKVGIPTISGRRIKIPVRITNLDDNKIVIWMDTILLRRINGNWLVSNIFYETQNEFKYENSLRKFLRTEY